jgi:hypothetical protein
LDYESSPWNRGLASAMPVPAYSLVPFAKEDLSVVADFLHTCKLALPINRLLIKDWPNPAVQKPMYHGAITGSFDNPDVVKLKAVDDSSGALLGFVVFTRKRPDGAGDSAGTGAAPSPPATPAGLDDRVFQAVVATDMAFRDAIKNTDHIGKSCTV